MDAERNHLAPTKAIGPNCLEPGTQPGQYERPEAAQPRRGRLRHLARSGGLLVLIAGFTMMGPVGCVSTEQIDALQARLNEQRATLDRAVEQNQHALDALPTDSPDRRAAQDQLEQARLARDAMQAAQQQLDLTRRAMDNPAGAIQGGASAILPFLPAPAQLPVLLGAGLLGALLRARQMKSALASVAQGLNAAMKDDPDFKNKFREHATTFRAVQTRTAARVVDEVTKDGLMVRLPF